METLKIGMFTDTLFEKNGVAVHVKTMSREIMDKGHDVTIYTASKGMAKNLNIRWYSSVPDLLTPPYRVALPHGRPKVDVAHIHTQFTVGHFAKRLKVPRFVTTHQLAEHFFDIFKPIIPSKGVEKSLDSFFWKYLIDFFNDCDYVVAQTESTARLYKRHGLKKEPRIISCGVDTDNFSPKDPSEFISKYNIKEPYVLFVGRFTDDKRPDQFVEIAKKADCNFVMIGGGPELGKLREAEKKMQNLKVINERLPKELLAKAYSGAAVFCTTSRAETEGLVAIEAMACGTPVVIRDMEPFSDYVTSGKEGYLAKETSDFVKGIKKVLSSKTLQKKMGAEALKTAKKRSVHSSAKNLIDYYKKSLE
jgi:glycosyltransferase involved in cell wall biosynthesis